MESTLLHPARDDSALRLCSLPCWSTLAVPAFADERLDASLRDTLERGCSGTQSVIIRTRPGERETMKKSLVSQGTARQGRVSGARCDRRRGPVRRPRHARSLRQCDFGIRQRYRWWAPVAVEVERFHVGQVDRGGGRAAASGAAVFDAGRAPVAARQSLAVPRRRRSALRLSTRASSRVSTSAAALRPFTISRTAIFARRRRPMSTATGRMSRASPRAPTWVSRRPRA